MAAAFDAIGYDEDVVQVRINDVEYEAMQYTISTAMFSRSPSSFTASIRTGEGLAEAYAKIKPGMRFEVLIDGIVQQTGRLDAVNGVVNQNGSVLNVTGRDNLAKLHDARAERDYGFAQGTYLDLVERVLGIVGVEGDILSSNDANRAAMTGKQQRVIKSVSRDGKVDSGYKTTPVHIKCGESWWPWLKKINDHAGLCLFAGANGLLIFTAPNVKQGASYEAWFRRGLPRSSKFFTEGNKTNNTTQRPSKVIVRCKGGGHKSGTKDIEGVAIDQEMIDYGIDRTITITDYAGSTTEGATLCAKRKLAEARRLGWSMNYEAVGHVWDAVDTRKKAVWAPDTILKVHDDEHGFFGDLWIESVEMGRTPGTSTKISCMRPEDVSFFGED